MLDVAIDAAKQAGELALKYFKSQPKVSYKADKSPVTIADLETEKLIRRIINRKFPDHGIIGEELPPVNPKADYQWVIDPIDGTRDFIRRIPFWANYIAVLKNNKPIMGVIFLPILGDMITSQKGNGTFLNDQKVHVSKTKKLEEAYISHGQIKRFVSIGKKNQLLNLAIIVRSSRNYGNFGLKLLLEGKIDAVLEAGGGFHDFAAPKIIVEEAGGKFSDFSGKNLLTSGNGIWTNKLLHNQVLKILNSR
ncbi:MAG: hypothetical protein UW78_C0022G0004 [Candidatus Azambacteria bacterium GW2011_GWA1_44_9]|uniref:Inositol monophosphatase n=1 Tax=Candidatus Azambacteria bacterium GW2011_GWA1_44_9 TaxID=1618610 RepID=A0A0G1KBC9_9BACT|nr:MAG: hypothetical protein UW78_C0022G0004 [Candidatus Azambacteria bacterium GW2011_GWA1_44_9]